MGRRDRILAWIVPIVLVAVASQQLFLASTRDLTPWKGGGFGMFASVDRLNYRAVHGTFVTSEGDVPFEVHTLVEQGDYERITFVNARALLDERRGARLADIVAHGEWVIEDGVARLDDWLPLGFDGPVVRSEEDGTMLPVEAIRLEVWRAAYRHGSGVLVPVPAGSLEFEVQARVGGAP